MKKLFGGINLTWKKLILFSIISGVYTALVAILPICRYTSFETIAVTFEVWILFGIVIIMNSKSNKDAALKCFIFFLISQPLIYLLQVPFSWQGWGLFKYYKFWFIWTVLCIPMGFIGYYIKKDKWWGYLILLPMILLTAYSYLTDLTYLTFSYPKYTLICLFCIITMIIYPLYIFKNKKIRITGVIISALLIIASTVYVLLNPYRYNTQIMSNNEEHQFDNTYKVYLEDDKYGTLNIIYMESVEDYMIQANFKRDGKTSFTIESPTGEKQIYDIVIKRDTYEITKKN